MVVTRESPLRQLVYLCLHKLGDVCAQCGAYVQLAVGLHYVDVVAVLAHVLYGFEHLLLYGLQFLLLHFLQCLLVVLVCLQAYQDNQQALQKMQQEKLQPIQEKVLKAIENVGKNGNYVYIMQSNSQLYISSTLSTDVTELVKTEINKLP